ncbi:Chitin binding Peritrophin-A domain containing protein, partial [Euroglyphus maynei]
SSSSSRQFSRGQPESISNINSPPPLTSNPDPDDEGSQGNPGGVDFSCPKSDGLFADPNNCRKFNLCGNWRAWSQTCPPSLYFDSKLKYCTFKTEQLTCGPIDEAEVRAEERELSQDALPTCVLDECRLPNCFCTNDGTLIPDNIPPSQTPQMVLISFSGALNDLVYDHYRRVLGYGNRFNSQQTRRNPNGCGIRATFFINHEYSNYAQIQWFAAQGHEMAVHSITHRQPETWWTDHANYSEWAEEMIGMREIMIANAGGTTTTPVLTRDNIVGMRSPFIRPGGNAMFEMAHDFGFLYDSSIAAPRGTPPYWPFTYDYRQPFDCSNQPKKDESQRYGPTDQDSGYGRFGSGRGSNRGKRQTPFLGRALKCPTRSFPGLWEVPINPLFNEFNTCHHADQCVFPSASDDDDVESIVDFLKENFDRHYNTNRAPFQLNFHVTWFTQKRNIRALNRFLDHIQSLKDVWFVTFQQMLSWMRNPKPASESSFPCENNSTVYSCSRPHTCVVKHYLNKDNSAASEDNFSRADTRYMPVCHSSLCPQQYQWYGNTAGRKRNFKTIMQLIEENPPPPPPQSSSSSSESVNDRPQGDGGQ